MDYKKRPVKILGSITIPIPLNDWKIEDATFLISENRIQNLLGLDIHDKLGVVTTDAGLTYSSARRYVTRSDIGVLELVFCQTIRSCFQSSGQV